jgi:hypothetical protein
MKIINIHTEISVDNLLNFFRQNLNPRFQQYKPGDIRFSVENIEGNVEISEPENYEGFLYRIQLKGEELHITRSEHYTDDVNSLALESVLNELFGELAGEKGVSLVLEG